METGMNTEIESETIEKVADILCPYVKKVEQRYNNDVAWGYLTGFNDYDEITNGLHNSELTVIAGRHSMGKTTFALNLAISLAQQKIPVLYVSYDLSKEAIAEHLLTALAEVENTRIKSGNLSKKDWDKLTYAIDIIDKQLNKYLKVIPDCHLFYKDLFDKIRKFKSDNENGVVIVDYFQLIKLYRAEDTRIIELSSLAAAFKHLTMEIKLPIILLSQVSKKCEDRDNKRPMLSDLAECDALAQHSDNLIFIFREDYYNNISNNDEEEKFLKDKNVADFNIEKQKNGPIGQFKLLYQPQINKFKNIIHLQVEMF